MAYDLCFNHFPTMTITTAGSYRGTAGNDIVVIKHPGGMVYYDPVDGHDEICRLDTPGPFTVWTAGDGHQISAAGPSGVTIYGSEGPDDIGGSSGNDTLNAGADNVADYLYGGPGTDKFYADNDGLNVCYPEWGPATMACGHNVTG